MTVRTALLAAGFGLALARAAGSGPCQACAADGRPFPLGWRDDLPIAGPDTSSPRIDVDGTLAAVVFEDRRRGDGDLQLATSRDGGCSWAIQAVTTGPADDRFADVAVSDPLGVVAVVFVREGAVLATTSGDGGVTFSTPERLDPLAAPDGNARPRIGSVPAGGSLHLHVAWSDNGRLRYVRSLAAGAPGSFESGPPISDRIPGFGPWIDTDLAADSRSARPGTDSAVTIVASAPPLGSAVLEVFVLRSIDSGVTFFGDPTDPATRDRPLRLSDPRPADPAALAAEPLVDASDDGSGAFVNWTLAAWSDRRSGRFECFADARAEEGATPSVASDWNSPPIGDVRTAPADATAAAVAVIPNPLGRPPLPEAAVFHWLGTGGSDTELGAIRARLNPAATPNLEITCPAAPLTGLFPPRPAGSVLRGQAAADEDLSDVYLVWTDSRDGQARVYFKRTDSVTAAPGSPVASPGACPAGGIQVTFVPPPAPPHCDVDHYRIDYGPSPGAYDRSVDVGVSPAALTGLVPGNRYYLLVTTVDQACNQRSAFEVSAVAPDCTGTVACPSPVGNTLKLVRERADVVLAWEPPPADAGHDPATSYDLHRATIEPSRGYQRIANPPGPAGRDFNAVPPFSPSPHHYYRVVARNACGTSGDEPPP